MSEKSLFDLFGGEEEVGEKVETTEEAEVTSLLPPSEQVKTGTKQPIFQYADIKDELKDLNVTLEDLRKKYASDFPELEKKEKVTYKVDYAYTRMCKPTEKVADIKAEMEKDKRFTDQLKKLKSPLQMAIKPVVSGQTKGYISDNSFNCALNAELKRLRKGIKGLVSETILDAAEENLYSEGQVKKLSKEKDHYALKLWEFYNRNYENNLGEDLEYSEEFKLTDTEYLKEVLFKQTLGKEYRKINLYDYYPKDIA